jgi:hypothetical protein
MLKFNFAELRESKFRRYLQADLVFLIFVLLFVYFVVSLQVSSIEEKISVANSKISNLQKTLNRLRKIKKDEKRLLSLKDKLKRKLSVVSELERKRHVPYFLYFFANPQNLKGIWLEQVRYDLHTLKVSANALDVKYIPPFFDSIEKKLGTVKLKNVERKTYKGKEIVLNYYHFEFDVRLYNGSNHRSL